MDKSKTLTPDILNIIKGRGTEPPFSGEYEQHKEQGSYLCRQCGIALFRADAKFTSTCGWPSFDDDIADHIKTQLDADGRRQEILCVRCDAHLGHVFHGEHITAKNIRYCVNSLALDFVANSTVTDSEEAIYAAGCFWGVQYLFDKLPGVLKTEVGYTGGGIPNPTYDMVCRGSTGHVEAIRVLYDPQQITYEQLTKYFFEIHDPTQQNGQGPDIGPQYLSRIFYLSDEQQQIAAKIVNILHEKHFSPVTQLVEAKTFWQAEDYHQAYYAKKGTEPYCHLWAPLFED